MLERPDGAGGQRVVARDGLRAAVGRHPGQRGDRHRDQLDRRTADARGRGRPECDPAAELRARGAEPVRHAGRLLRGRHRRRDHRSARGHLRLARARRPGRVGERVRSPSPRRPTQERATHSSRCRPRRSFLRSNQCASAGGYQNPFAHATAIVPERIDMGVDYTASGRDRRAGRRDRHLLAGRGRRLGTVRLLGRATVARWCTDSPMAPTRAASCT